MKTIKNPPKIKTIKITGMTCQACATRLEKALNKKSAIATAQVNFASETLLVTTNGELDDDELLAWIKKVGFTGQFIKNSQNTQETKNPPYALIALGLLSAPFWLGMIGMLFGSHQLMPPIWLQFVLASLAQFGFGLSFYKGAWASLKSGMPNMDLLIALGSSVIWLYSIYAWQMGAEVYFEAGVMILTFIRLGKYLEHRTKTGSLNATTGLMALLPQTVYKKVGDNWTATTLTEVQIGDVLQARHGDKIAVDGVLLDGVGKITQAHLTGESHYLSKQYGDEVLAGSVVVDGSFSYQAKATGSQTALGQMTDALIKAQGSKAPIARLADRVAGVFVPCVVAVAVLAFLLNFYFLAEFDTALMRAVAVLVIACPCALGLATPTAIMAGMGVASRHGVQFLDATALETTGQITAMAFDKTGTLTNGKLSIIDIYSLIDIDKLLAISASLEQHSTHPLARAILDYAIQHKVKILNANAITSLAGQGIQGQIDDVGFVKIGTKDFAMATASFDPFIQKHQKASLVFVAINNQAVGAFALMDNLRDDASILIHKLKHNNISPIILSGDRQSVVDNIANQLGIVGFGDLSPQDKLFKINELKKQHKTAMVGDGVNDALAMTNADVGIAIGSATDVATGSAVVRLIHSNEGGIIHLYYAHTIAQLTLKTIKQNLFFAFIYNLIGIPLAMMGLLNPMLASLAMALSSLSVLANALRLTKIKLTQ